MTGAIYSKTDQKKDQTTKTKLRTIKCWDKMLGEMVKSHITRKI